MSTRTLARLAWSGWAVMAGLAILLRSRTVPGFPDAVAPALTLGAFMTVGAVLISRQPRNTVGWLCCAADLLDVIHRTVEPTMASLWLRPGRQRLPR